MKKFNYTYIIYCNEPKSSLYGRIYYGQHSTDNIFDGYIASGRIISNYIKKYPNGYYRKILHFYNTQEELNEAEYQLIHPYLNNPLCLNLRDGGMKGTDSEITKKLKSEAHKGEKNYMYGKSLKDFMTEQKYNELKNKIKLATTGENNPFYGKHHSEETCKKLSERMKGNKIFLGRHHSEEAKQKMSEQRKGKPCPMKGKHFSEEAVEHNREAQKLYWSTHTPARKGKHHTEEAKQKLREAHKGMHRVYNEDGTFHYER